MMAGRIVSFLVLGVLLISSISVLEMDVDGKDGSFGGGSGTLNDPYVIEDVWDLQNISSDLSAHYILGNDINASITKTWNSGAGFLPIGTIWNSFNGSFDGNEYNITGLYINRPSAANVGLFGYVSTGGIVRNVCLFDNNMTGIGLVGGIVGENEGMVSNCSNTGRVSGSNNYIGGIAGSNYYGIVSNCSNTGIAIGSGYYIGGLVGYNDKGTVFNSYATGEVSGGSEVGGLVGGNGGTVSNCYSSGNVNGNWGVGGLVGVNYKGTVSNSFYNVDRVLINGGHHLTIGALFDTQYQDWISCDLTLNISDYSATLAPSGGSYCISAVQGLRDLLGFVYVKSYKFRLEADIDLLNVTGFYIPHFSAYEFDGNNHTISNLHINMTFVDPLGMFGYVASSAIVRNLNINKVHVRGPYCIGGLAGSNSGILTHCTMIGSLNGSKNHFQPFIESDCIGGLVGYNWGIVSNCSAIGKVNGSDVIGGLVGSNDGTITNCSGTGRVNGSGNSIGGLVGRNDGMVSNCSAIGKVSGDSYVGGLVGENYKGTVSNSYATGDVNGRNDIGGIVGLNFDGTVSTSFAIGNVNGINIVGGLVGENDGTINKSYAGGNVSGSWCVGGLAGVSQYGTVSNSYATGNVSGAGDFVGGLVGFNYYGTVSNCYATGAVTRLSGKKSEFGGFIGLNFRGKILNCYSTGRVIYEGATNPTDKGFTGSVDTGSGYEMKGNFWDTQTSGQTSTTGNATGMNTAEMFTLKTFKDAGWDIVHVRGYVDEVWYIDEGYDYPRLGWEYYRDIHSPVTAAGPDQTVKMGETVFLNGSMSMDNIGIVSYTWTFTDGSLVILSGMLQSYRFDNAGDFIVTLNVTDGAGNWATDTLTVTVNDTEAPVANAGPDQVINMGETAHFNASLSRDNVDIVSYNWSFTDRVPITLSGILRSHGFDDAGVFVVTLNVTDSAGNWATDTMTVTVLDIQVPVANAGPSQVINMGETAHFNASRSADNVGIVSYTWTIIDGELVTLSGLIQSHRFDNAGVFVVTLNVTDSSGNWNIDTMIVTVLDIARPKADAGPDLIVDEGALVTFDGSDSYDNIGIANWTWTFMDGKSITLYGPTPEYLFNNPGVFTVTLNVTDAAGNWATGIMDVTVRDITSPTANAGSDQRVAVGSKVIFDGYQSTDNVGIVRYSWTFSYDGKDMTLIGPMVEFIFDKAGEYEMDLTVFDENDNTGTDNIVIIVIDTGTVKGTVLDENGNLVEGAKVEIASSNGQTYSTTTGANGSFSLVVFHGNFNWSISKEGYKGISGSSSVKAMGEALLDLSDHPLVSEEKKKDRSSLFFIVLLAVLLLMVLGIAFYLLIRKKIGYFEE
jgi:hypothetical protein